jgi:prepilin-type N-terminal cleavage/methylation domain-containing protein
MQGFTLIEVVVALAVLVISLTAIGSVATTSARATRSVWSFTAYPHVMYRRTAAQAAGRQLHANTSASSSAIPAWSFFDSTGSISSGHAMPIVGSFHARVRSCSGA